MNKIIASESKAHYGSLSIEEDVMPNPVRIANASSDGSFIVKNSMTSVVCLMLNSMIGSGILVQCYVFKEAGIMNTLLEYIVVGTMLFFGVYILVKSASETHTFDYSLLCDIGLGSSYGGIIFNWAIIVENSGCILSCILMSGAMMRKVLLQVAGAVEDESKYYSSEGALSAIAMVVFVIPFCLLKRVGELQWLSYYRLVVISSTILFIIFSSMLGNKYTSDQPSNSLNMSNAAGSLYTFGDVVFALGFTSTAFHAFMSCEKRTVGNFSKAVVITSVIGNCVCFFTGLCGYLIFRSETQTNILQNMDGSTACIFQAAVTIYLLLYLPAEFIVMRASILDILEIDIHKLSKFMYYFYTLLPILCLTGIGITLEVYFSTSVALALIVNLTGAVASMMTKIIFPGIIGIRILKHDFVMYGISVLLLTVGTCSACVALTSVVYSSKM